MPNLLDWGQPAPETPALPESEPARTAEVVRPTRTSRTGRVNPGRSQGEHGTGGNKYTPADVGAVQAILRGTTYDRPVSVARISMASGLNGRTVRAILSERDGIDFLVGACATGELFDASHDPVGGGGFTLKLGSQVRRMAERIRRRNIYAETHGAPPVRVS